MQPFLSWLFLSLFEPNTRHFQNKAKFVRFFFRNTFWLITDPHKLLCDCTTPSCCFTSGNLKMFNQGVTAITLCLNMSDIRDAIAATSLNIFQLTKVVFQNLRRRKTNEAQIHPFLPFLKCKMLQKIANLPRGCYQNLNDWHSFHGKGITLLFNSYKLERKIGQFQWRNSFLKSVQSIWRILHICLNYYNKSINKNLTSLLLIYDLTLKIYLCIRKLVFTKKPQNCCNILQILKVECR